jgi:hypothetical protein
VNKSEADGDVPAFKVWLAIDEWLVRLSGAGEKRGPSLNALAVWEGMSLEVEQVSALVSPLPCVEIDELLRGWREWVHEVAERAGG